MFNSYVINSNYIYMYNLTRTDSGMSEIIEDGPA